MRLRLTNEYVGLFCMTLIDVRRYAWIDACCRLLACAEVIPREGLGAIIEVSMTEMQLRQNLGQLSYRQKSCVTSAAKEGKPALAAAA